MFGVSKYNVPYRAPPEVWYKAMLSKLEKFEKFTSRFSHYLNWIAGIGIVAMAALIVADIIGNKVFKSPLPGGIEYIGFLGVVVIAFAIAQTQFLRGHIEVEFIVEYFPKKVQRWLSIFVYICLLALWAVIAWRCIDFGLVLQNSGEVSMTERIPFYPFVYAIAFCCIPTFMVMLIQLIRVVGVKK